MELKYLLFEKKENVAVIKFNRPKALNALNTEVLEELDKLIDCIKNDEQIYVAIFTGEGKAFVAGADISEMANFNADEGRRFSILGQRVFRKLELMEKPVIAAVNGYALGGGCEFAIACDIRVASEKAKFGQPEVTLGIIPGFAGTQRLSRLVGIAKAKELIFTGDMIDAEEAKRIGLVNKVVPHEKLMEESMNLAKKICERAQLAIRYSKMAINKGLDVDLDSGNDIEASYFGLCFATEDQKEGMKAFLEKRKAEFKAR
ncbi:enoyl-CoA hydratase [Caminicella sporogenes DSM 14501]|uniref:short-chain-enoyl-CoA hydratase n=1 Tax=Caminicella sporogenes DSM 14501 TaxID=1121266 RepID=A0A1M6QUG0_9FIRM|nr:short-chain-enoyl-CoA hydratase [Caminicella sporogenes]RKD20905.1 crotonase [Caminicella sporogenes]SHK23891.1 enoyl-CoA hydratase [Caminicella sporogenes DSM 14501]